MPSPSKRRKTSHDPSPSKPAKGSKTTTGSNKGKGNAGGSTQNTPVKNRSLEYFFGKSSNAPPHQPSFDGSLNGNSGGNGTLNLSQENGEDELTDEQLARKLQDEFNREAQQAEEVGQDSRREELYEVSSDGNAEALCGGGSSQVHDNNNGTTVEEDEKQDKTDLRSFAQQPVPKENTLSLQSATAEDDTISTTIPFDQSPLTFDPSEYLPQLKSQWAREGGAATYALLTRCFVLVNSTQSRIKIVDNLVNLIRVLIEGDSDSLLPAVWLATNSISPPYIDLELGLGGSAISKALKKVCGLDSSGLRTLYDKHGDAGDVAFEAKKRQSLTLRKPKPLSIKSVFDSLVKIANSKGQGSQENKQRIVERLVQDARGAEESRYIVRTLVQHLRIGAVKTTMLIALSRAFLLSKPPDAAFETRSRKQLSGLKKDELAEVWSRSEEIVKACYARRPNYNDLIPALLEIGVCDELLLRCGLAMHIPLRPMLGNITRDLTDMLTKLQGRDFVCEYKYDGQRAQVHCDDNGRVTIFSRHLEVMTEKYPDLVALVPQIRGEGVRSFILEGEVVAIDRESGDLRTFQTLTNRARKDVTLAEVSVTVCLFAFDLMYLNGSELLDRPFRERRSLLRSLFTEIPRHFTWVKSFEATSADAEPVLEFFKSAMDNKCEGIMVKVLDNVPNPELIAELQPDSTAGALDPAVSSTALKEETANDTTPSKSKKGKASKSTGKNEDETTEKNTRRKALLATYEPDKRIDSWLKVKKDYSTSTSDTLDLIPIGGWHGQGRKAKWWSPILLAVRNPETGCLEAVTKCISGFTDKFYAANKEKYAEGSENVISRPSYVEYAGEPAVWFAPQEVWEVAFADITLSPTYTAAIGLVSEERGLSTRFPRFLKVREDKTLDEASTSDYLAQLWRKQEAKAPQQGPLDAQEEDIDED